MGLYLTDMMLMSGGMFNENMVNEWGLMSGVCLMGMGLMSGGNEGWAVNNTRLIVVMVYANMWLV